MRSTSAASAPAGDFAALVVPHGRCFVLCDARGQTRDSRSFGPVPLGDVLGRVEWVYWPRLKDVRPLKG
ncbi:MAG: S26 family signal peptidase [Phycisphaerae bacterium]|nr:S26 family signal peptidase [Phycisphaerae bacterium]